MINRERIFETFSQLVSLDSESGHERKMADTLCRLFEPLGVTLFEDDAGYKLDSDAGNLFGVLPKNAEGYAPLLFCAHMDTVQPGVSKKAVLHADGRITSAGDTVLGSDDVAGLVSILEAVRVIQERNLPHGDIEILFSVQEEAFCRGTRVFDFSKVRSKEAFVMDLEGAIGSAAVQAPSIFSFEAVIHGKSAHAGFMPEAGVHAIAVAADAISRMTLGHTDDLSTVNIGLISGGTAVNIVPDCCTLRGESRSFEHARAEENIQKIRRTLEDACLARGAQLEFSSFCGVPAFCTPAGHPSLARFENACRAANLPCALSKTLGGSDLNRLADHGIFGVVAACGMNDCHTTHEWTHLDDLEKSARLVLSLMTQGD